MLIPAQKDRVRMPLLSSEWNDNPLVVLVIKNIILNFENNHEFLNPPKKLFAKIELLSKMVILAYTREIAGSTNLE